MGSSLPVTVTGRRERQKRDRGRRILSAARRLFERKGYAGTAMENVAERAGLAVGTLYNYFPSKDDLLLTILRRESEEVARAGERVLADPPEDPVAAVAALADLYIQIIGADQRMLWRELFAASIAAPRTLGARLFDLDRQLIAQFESMTRKLMELGRLGAEVDPARAAGLFYGICLTWGIAFSISDSMSADTMRHEVAESVRMTVRGLLPPVAKEIDHEAR